MFLMKLVTFGRQRRDSSSSHLTYRPISFPSLVQASNICPFAAVKTFQGQL